MNVPMFNAEEYSEVQRPVTFSDCQVPGPFASWQGWYLANHTPRRHPVCNRKTRHPGPHREYDRNARVRAEWA